jgi:hypothetical protein
MWSYFRFKAEFAPSFGEDGGILTAERSRASSAASSCAPVVFFDHISRKSAGRGRLPTCVVKIRLVLRLIGRCLPRRYFHTRPDQSQLPLVERVAQLHIVPELDKANRVRNLLSAEIARPGGVMSIRDTGEATGQRGKSSVTSCSFL